jgi:hypothetical protein
MRAILKEEIKMSLQQHQLLTSKVALKITSTTIATFLKIINDSDQANLDFINLLPVMCITGKIKPVLLFI